MGILEIIRLRTQGRRRGELLERVGESILESTGSTDRGDVVPTVRLFWNTKIDSDLCVLVQLDGPGGTGLRFECHRPRARGSAPGARSGRALHLARLPVDGRRALCEDSVMGPVFRSENARARIDALSDRILATTRTPFRETLVQTSHGRTNIVRSEPDGEKSPLIILHGGSGNAAITAWLFEDLARRFHLVLPDVIGGVGKSEEKFLDPGTAEQGEWLAEIVDQVGTTDVDILAISQGALPALRYLEHPGCRVGRIALYVPAGVVDARVVSTVARFLLPLAAFRQLRLDLFFRFLEGNIFDGVPDPRISDFFREVFAQTRFDTRQPRRLGAVCPQRDVEALVISAGEDLFFDGARLQARAKGYFGRGVETIRLENAKHSLTKEQDRFDSLVAAIGEFFGGAEIAGSLGGEATRDV